MLTTCALAAPAEHPGKALYQKLCAECHGSKGQGVEDEYDDALTGEKSIEALARQIDRTMAALAANQADPDAAFDANADWSIAEETPKGARILIWVSAVSHRSRIPGSIG